MIFKDYYKILEFNTNRVTAEQIRTSYRVLAKKYHPDVNIGNRIAEERFKDINEAYRVLSDIQGRKKYDKMWTSNIGNKRKTYEESKRSKDSVTSDFFDMFFGNNKEPKEDEEINSRKKAPLKGENVETEISISIEDAFIGVEKKISLRTVNATLKTFSVKIPAGIRNGEKIRLLGQGKTGKNGGRNGDLFIKITIQDNNKFRLSGCDILTDLLITPWDAALGTRATVQCLDNTAAIYIPQGIESGEKVRIPGKGYKDGKGGRGDIIAEVKIMVPKRLTAQEKELFEQLQEISKFNPQRLV